MLDRAARSRRALRRTLFWGLCFGLPLSILIYYKLEYAGVLKLPNFGEVQPFYLTTTGGESVSNHSLRAAVTLVLVEPQAGVQTALTADEAQKLSLLTSWVKEKLEVKDADEQAYRLLFLSASGVTPRSPLLAWQQALGQDATTLKAFLPQLDASAGRQLVVIDHNTEIRGVYPLTAAPVDALTRTLARLNFNHYLNDYLAKRTFFGPRRV